MEASLDRWVLLVVHNLPQALLVALVVLVVGLIAKDALNGAFRKPFLNPDRFQPLTCVDIKTLSHNTRRFRFALPHQEQMLGLPLGQHITIKGTAADGTTVLRCVAAAAAAAAAAWSASLPAACLMVQQGCCPLVQVHGCTRGSVACPPPIRRDWRHTYAPATPRSRCRCLFAQLTPTLSPACCLPAACCPTHAAPLFAAPRTGPTLPPPSCSSGATSTL